MAAKPKGCGWDNKFFRRLEGISVASSLTEEFAPELMDIIETRSS